MSRMLSLLVTVTVLVFSLHTLPARADKADDADLLLQLGEQIVTGKGQTLTSTEFDQLMSDYTTLSDALGGYDPYNLVAPADAPDQPLAAPAAPPNTVATTTGFMNNTATPIPDGPGGSVSVMLPVSGVDPVLWDLDVTVDITHTWSGDLDIIITSPAGTMVTLTSGNAGSADDVYSGTLFDDQGGTPATQFVYTDGVTATPLVPEGALGAFYGEDPNGNWTLTVNDNAGADTGTINSWSLDVTTLDVAAAETAPGAASMASGAAIPDGPGGMLSESVTVSGLDDFLCDVDVTVDITHTWSGDLDFDLTSPAGTVVPLTVQNGGNTDDIYSGSLFNDDAPTPVSDYMHADLVTSTPMAPEGALAAFIGEDPNGAWTLTITDNAGADTGTLNSWDLSMQTCRGLPQVTNVPTLSPVGLGLLVLVLAAVAGTALRRRYRTG